MSTPAYTVRVRYYCQHCGQDAWGWLCKDGTLSRYEGDARLYETEAEAWEHATVTDMVGKDEKGEYCRVEQVLDYRRKKSGGA